jgi:hypothetical protein
MSPETLTVHGPEMRLYVIAPAEFDVVVTWTLVEKFVELAEVKVIAGVPSVMVMVWVASPLVKFAVAAWSTWMSQLPTAVGVTRPEPLTVQVPPVTL